MPSISDSDLVRDAKRVHWLPVPILTDAAAATAASSPEHSIDSLIEPDGMSTKTNKGLRNVKAKMQAVARFLSGSKRPVSDAATGVSDKGLPIAGQGVPSIVVACPRGDVVRKQAASRGDVPGTAKEVCVQVGATDGNVERPAIDSLRERLVAQQGIANRPPPPPPPTLPPLPLPKQRDFPPDVLQPMARPPIAVAAKKRYGNGLERGLGLARHGLPRTRTATPHPAHSPAVRLASRPLPPTPAVLPTLSTSLPIAEQQQAQHQPQPQRQQHQQRVCTSDQLPELGLCNHIRPCSEASSKNSENTIADSHVDANLRLERFPSLRRRADGMLLNANRLAEELDSLVTFTAQRRRRQQARSNASSATAAHVADSSNAALYHWRPSDKSARAISPFDHYLQQQQLNEKFQVAAGHTAEPSSLFVEDSSEELESVKRIQNWRVNIMQAPSVLSKVASAHSRCIAQDDGVSSHLTSISRSPLSKNSAAMGGREQKGKVKEAGSQTTSITQAHLIPKIDWDILRDMKVSGAKSVKSSDRQPPPISPLQLGTHHIARLSDSQFDRLARATERSPPSAPIPCEPSTLTVPGNSSRQHLHAAALPTTPTYLLPTHMTEDDRRTSLDTPATTLSVLEKKASQHIDTLDGMIRRHPDQMYRIFKNRPGLLLVVMLRYKVEERISAVPPVVDAAPLVDLAMSRDSTREAKGRDCLSLIEESLIDLRFDDERAEGQQKLQTDQSQYLSLQQRSAAVEQSTQSIDTSQHHTGALGNVGSLSRSPPIPSSSASINAYRTTTIVADEEVEVAELGSRGEAVLQEIILRFEKAGELCSVQQTLIALQDRLMNANTDCSRLRERLSVVSPESP
ncbi:hypothetical protein EX895_005949 [Sporisorium graminicola]|uniref:Uncharacterized protein n=1 Tax=Sporisorium graminicola TaxID=280036 RepID=A0A4V6YEK8_9BASI|nr:hypothetical protein EX895_005949 [Sporisorium graminicola]TKY84869.1 hypothetical protein EX895_005949 [Sporisorium graminicola]